MKDFKDRERAILVGLAQDEDIDYYMEELENLAFAAEINVIATMTQNRGKPDPALYLGRGKAEELVQMADVLEADLVIFNEELSGVQLRNLEDTLGIKIIDRTILILDIFAERAISKEGKLQVELAQLQYRLPRLTGFGKALSRLGGGIGTRGPGEKKLETDRRHIKNRMGEIKRELVQSRGNRDIKRARREKSEIPMVALVGYTNAGKSALMNSLLRVALKEEKQVFEEDMLFATLDTAHRHVKLDTNHEFIVIDTVGFVSNLPHNLIKAFMATLEEAKYADLLLHVTDASFVNNDFQIRVTEEVLKQIGADQKDRIMVFNKCDLLEEEEKVKFEGRDSICISATEGYNIEQLLDMIKDRLFAHRIRAGLLIPFTRGDIHSYLLEKYPIINSEFKEQGYFMELELSEADYGRFREFETVKMDAKI